MADGITLSHYDQRTIGKLFGERGLSKEQSADLFHFLDDVQSDVRIANYLVDLAHNVVGNLTVRDDEQERREQEQACSAIFGVELQLNAVAQRLEAIGDKLRAKS